MHLDTERYEFSHGKKPKGRGAWMFEMTGTDGEGRYTTETLRASGTLTEARRQAVRDFKLRVGGVKEIVNVVVLP